MANESSSNTRADGKQHIGVCKGCSELYPNVDPADNIVRVFWCPVHKSIDYMFPKSMMIIWPDGKTTVWEGKKDE